VGLQRLIGNWAVQRLLIQRSALSSQLKNMIDQQPKPVVFAHMITNHVALNADPDVLTLIGSTYAGDELWMVRTWLASGAENTWPIQLKVEREMRAGGHKKDGVYALLRTANGAHAASVPLTTSLQAVLAGDDLWIAQQLQQHGIETHWPLHVKFERQMKAGGGGKDAAFTTLRGVAGAGAADVNLTNAIARVFPGGDDLWTAQQLQAYGQEAQWPLNRKIEREMRTGGGGKDAIFVLLRGLNGASAADIPALNAITAAFTAGSNDLWFAQQLLRHGQEAGWTNDLKVQRMLRGFAPVDQPAILVLLLAATAPQFDDALRYMSQHHNTVILEMLYAASDANFGTFMSSMTQDQTTLFLDNVSKWNKVYYSTFMTRIKTGRLLATGQAKVGNYRWRGGSGPDAGAGYKVSTTTAWGHPNEFAAWIRGTGGMPGDNSVMNCWQGVLFLAFKAGLISLAWLQAMDKEAADAATAASAAKTTEYYAVLQKHMYSGSKKTLTFDGAGVTQPTMPAGQIVFINGMNHVLLSKGGRDGTNRQQVLSLWIYPAHVGFGPLNQLTSYGVLQDTTLEEVHPLAKRKATDKLEYAAPPW